jgi:hypothetical protein
MSLIDEWASNARVRATPLVSQRFCSFQEADLCNNVQGAVSWQHINLLGEYDFSDEKLQDSVGIKPPKLAA